MELILIENESKNFEDAMKAEMNKAIKHFEGELIKIRTGRAHTSLIESIPVSVYGQSPMPLKQLAALAAPDSNLLTIQPWDASTINEIEKAILNSDVGLSPQNDGKIIRLKLPEMSTTRRDELVKMLGKRTEEAKVAIRNIRKDFKNLITDSKKDKSISENFFNRLSDILQKITDEFIAKVDQMHDKKERDIRTV